MDHKKWKSKGQKQKIYALLLKLGIPILFIILVLISLGDYYKTNGQRLRSEVFQQLNETAMGQIDTFKAELEGRFGILETACVSLSLQDKDPNDYVLTKMKEIVDIGNFYHIGYIDSKNGIGFTSGRTSFDASGKDYFHKSLAGERAIEYVDGDNMNGVPLMILSIPLYKEGKILGVIFGSFEVDGFARMLITEAFDKESYFIICDSKGDFVLEGSHKDFQYSTENILEVYEDSIFENGITLEDISADLLSNTSGMITYQEEGMKKHASYLPLGVNDWMMFNIVPESYVDKQVQDSAYIVWILTIKLMVLCIGLAILIFLQEHKKSEQLRVEQERNKIVEEFTDSVLFECDYHKDTITFNGNYFKVFEHEPEIEKLSEVRKLVDSISSEDVAEFYDMVEQLETAKKDVTGEIRIIKRSGKVQWYRVETKRVFDYNGKPSKIFGRIYSIEDLKRQVLEFKDLSELDSLTGLLNRAAMNARIQNYLQNTDQSSSHALLLIDVDNFKAVNDHYGHIVGDRVLIGLAERMKDIVRETDLVGRFGGDEFVIFLKDGGKIATITSIAERLCHTITEIELAPTHEKDIAVSCSIGVAIYPDNAKSYTELYEKSDIALYAAKEKGKNCFVLYQDVSNK